MKSVKIGLVWQKPNEFSLAENVKSVDVSTTGQLLIRWHDGNSTCYASGYWNWFYFMEEAE